MEKLTTGVQTLVAASVFFVWTVRYSNIVEEFKHYGLPDWLRDLVGIIKLTFALQLLIGIEHKLFAMSGGIGIALLMVCAFITHVRVRNPFPKMLPCLILLLLSVLISAINYQLLKG